MSHCRRVQRSVSAWQSLEVFPEMKAGKRTVIWYVWATARVCWVPETHPLVHSELLLQARSSALTSSTGACRESSACSPWGLSVMDMQRHTALQIKGQTLQRSEDFGASQRLHDTA